MQPKQNHQLLTSIKWLFVSGTLAVMIWLWGWFSNQNIKNYSQKNQLNSSNNTTQANVVVIGANGQPVSGPTSVTLRGVSSPATSNQQPMVITTNRNSGPFTSTGSSRP